MCNTTSEIIFLSIPPSILLADNSGKCKLLLTPNMLRRTIDLKALEILQADLPSLDIMTECYMYQNYKQWIWFYFIFFAFLFFFSFFFILFLYFILLFFILDLDKRCGVTVTHITNHNGA